MAEINQADLDKYLAELKKDVKKDNATAGDSYIGIECSAKSGQNVNELFTEICRKLIALYK